MGVEDQIGKRIRAARAAKGWSQGELSDATGLSRSYISRLEGGHTIPGQRLSALLSEAFGIPIRELISGVHVPEVSDEDFTILSGLRKCSRFLTAEDKRAILARARKMAKV